MSIRFEGLDGVINRLEKISNPKGIEQALGQACALVERSAKEKCPVDDGELRRSISSKVEGLTGIVFTPLEYAPYVEYGTGLFAEGGNGRTDVPWLYEDEEGKTWVTAGQKPQPFMRPALDENRANVIRIIQEGITK